MHAVPKFNFKGPNLYICNHAACFKKSTINCKPDSKRSNILSTVYDWPIEPLRPSTNPLHSASSTFGQDEKMLWQDALLVLRSQNTFGMKSRSSFTSETMIRGASCAIFGRSTEIWEMDDEVLEAATDCWPCLCYPVLLSMRYEYRACGLKPGI